MTQFLHCTVCGRDTVTGNLLCNIEFEELRTALWDVTLCDVTEMCQSSRRTIYLNL
jgi:hypothetical protein